MKYCIVYVEAVEAVEGVNLSQQHRRSIIVTTADRKIKIAAPTKEAHETWLSVSHGKKKRNIYFVLTTIHFIRHLNIFHLYAQATSICLFWTQMVLRKKDQSIFRAYDVHPVHNSARSCRFERGISAINPPPQSAELVVQHLLALVTTLHLAIIQRLVPDPLAVDRVCVHASDR